MKKNKFELIFVCFLLSFFVLLSLYFAATNSNNDDERAHITAGYAYLKFNDYSFNVEHPPLIKQLSALPLLFLDVTFPVENYKKYGRKDISAEFKLGKTFLYKLGNDLDKMLFFSRIPNIIIALMLGIFIFLFSRELNGVYAGILSVVLFSLSPNFIAHSSLVTTDTALACFFFVAVYFLWKYFSKGYKWPDLFFCALFLGAALVSKYSALILIPVIYLLIFFEFVFFRKTDHPVVDIKLNIPVILLLILFVFTVSYKWSFRFMAPALFMFGFSFLLYKSPSYKRRISSMSLLMLFVLIIGFAVVVLDYIDYRWFPFHSATKAYFKGFSHFRGHSGGGHNSFLLGGYSPVGWWYYFPLAIMFKTPAVSLLLMLLGLAGLFVKNNKLDDKVYLTLPVACYLFVACFINKVNIGIRHILVIYPFLFVIAGYGFKLFGLYKLKRLYKGLIIGVIFTFMFAESVKVFPGYISYFNIFIGGSGEGFKYLGDSNISWGTDCKILRDYLKNKQIESVFVKTRFISNDVLDYYNIPYVKKNDDWKKTPVPGYYVLDLTSLQDRSIEWINEIDPLDKIGASLFLYKIKK